MRTGLMIVFMVFRSDYLREVNVQKNGTARQESLNLRTEPTYRKAAARVAICIT